MSNIFSALKDILSFKVVGIHTLCVVCAPGHTILILVRVHVTSDNQALCDSGSHSIMVGSQVTL